MKYDDINEFSQFVLYWDDEIDLFNAQLNKKNSTMTKKVLESRIK